MTLSYLAHILGFTLWLGAGLAAMFIGIRGRKEERPAQALIVRMLHGIHRTLMLPGIILTVLSGFHLSVPAARQTAPTAWLMAMQLAGVVAALLVIFVSLPTLGRLTRLSPSGDTAPLFDALRKRQSMAGMIAGNLGLISLIAGVLHKY
jgi:TRAP-type C4-dicarboxylate transport system permease small subunit